MVDGDDRVERKGLFSLVQKLKKIESVDMVFSPYYKVDVNTGRKQEIGYLLNSNNLYLNDKLTTLKEFSKKLFVTMHGITYRTELLKKSDYRIDENCFYVDVEYTIYYLIYVKKFYF